MTELITLASLAETRCWVAWQVEVRKAGAKPTKIPYSPSGFRASANKPSSWGTRAAAEIYAAKLPRPSGIGGIGLQFTTVTPGRRTAGIDFDSCHDCANGILLPWAQIVVDRLASYTEVSPSGSGVKTFFTIDAADYLTLREALGRNSAGEPLFSKNWKLAGGDHPSGVEVHFGNRYFATTFRPLEGSTAELRAIPTNDLIQLIQVDLPAFIAKHGNVTPFNGTDSGSAGKKGRLAAGAPRRKSAAFGSVDKSRSAAAFAVGGQARRDGADFAGMCNAVRTHPKSAEWYAEKGAPNMGRELRRIWEKTDPVTSELVLSRGKPLHSAQQFVGRTHTVGQARTLLHQNATFYVWQKTHYRERPFEEVRSQIYSFLETSKVITEEGEMADFDPTKPRVANVAEALAAEVQITSLTRPPAWLIDGDQPSASEIIACANTLLHLPTGETFSHTPSFFTLNALPFDYQPEAAAPEHWLAFLQSVWTDDQEAIDALQELFGLCLTGETHHQKAFLLVGPKRSGKGTIARVLTKLLGADNVVSPTLSGLGTNFGLAPLIGKRLAIISDARLSGKADQQIIVERLLSITGEDGFTIDRKFREGWTGKLDTRFIILTNEMPCLTDSSGALASRFVILRMVQSFYGKEDLKLGSKLELELPGILQWAIAGWKRLTARGYFETPSSSAAAQQELEDLGSPIGAFLRDRCEVGAGKTVLAKTLYEAWRSWCREQGRDRPGDVQSFGRDLGAAVAGLTRRQPVMPDGSRPRSYDGVALAPAYRSVRDGEPERGGTRDDPLHSNSTQTHFSGG